MGTNWSTPLASKSKENRRARDTHAQFLFPELQTETVEKDQKLRELLARELLAQRLSQPVMIHGPNLPHHVFFYS